MTVHQIEQSMAQFNPHVYNVKIVKESRSVKDSLECARLFPCLQKLSDAHLFKRPKYAAYFGRACRCPKNVAYFGHDHGHQTVDLRGQILQRIAEDAAVVWTPADFADLAGRAAVDKALQRLATSGDLRRIDRGLYDKPGSNKLTGKPTVPNYQAVIQAVARRDNVRFIVDGMTAANDLGLTTAVPAKIEVLVDSRLKSIKLGNQEIRFKPAAVSRLTWAGRPGMCVVQALYWLQDMMPRDGERERIASILRRVFADPKHGQAIQDDLRKGIGALPIWMQNFLRPLLFDSEPTSS